MSDPVGGVQLGLWRFCQQQQGQSICIAFDCNTDTTKDSALCSKMQAARAFVTMACILSAFAAICLFTRVVESLGSNTIVSLISKALPILSLISGIIGVALGISFATSATLNLKIGGAAIVAIIALIVNLVGAVLAFLAR